MYKTQVEAVLWHMQTYGSITSIEAIMEYGITRLAAKVFELKKQGWNIIAETENGVNRLGHPVQYARYRLGEQSDV